MYCHVHNVCYCNCRSTVSLLFTNLEKKCFGWHLSRVYIDEDDSTNRARSLEEDLICAVNFMLSNTLISNPKLEEMRVTTKADTMMNKLKQVILSGWPSNCKQMEVPTEIWEYWNYRDELIEVNDNIKRGKVGHTRKKMLTKIYMV